jgi:sucrose-6-phosphate hydrolase SacC (GH32 family)
LGEAPVSLERVAGDLFDVEVTFELGSAATVGLDVRGQKIEYAVKDGQLNALGKSAALPPENGTIRLRILVDRTSVEVFANGGRVQMASCFLPAADNKTLAVYASGGSARATTLKVWELKSAWREE